MPNTTVPAAATGLPSRLPHRMTRGDEFLHLMEQRRLIDRRLGELAESFSADPTGGPRLPKSGLRIMAVSLATGGQHDQAR